MHGEDWMFFSDGIIKAMDVGDDAARFWKVWKPILVQIFEAKGIVYQEQVKCELGGVK